MTTLAARLSAVRRSRDEGSALAIALVFLMIFGVYVGTVLQFASTGQRTAGTVRDEATDTYAGGGAIDGAINAIRGTTGTGVDPGTASPPAASPCFYLARGTARQRQQPRRHLSATARARAATRTAWQANRDSPCWRARRTRARAWSSPVQRR